MTIEEFNELQKRLSESKIPTRYETYHEELKAYFSSKLGGLPAHIILELAQYATFATMLVANAEVQTAYDNWRGESRKRLLKKMRINTSDDEVTHNDETMA